MSKIALDLGGSALRSMYQNKQGGSSLMKMRSSFIRIPVYSRVIKDLPNKYDDFHIVETTMKEAIGRYARGEASRYFDGVPFEVDNQELKVNQVATYVNAIHVLAKYVLNVFGSVPVEIKNVGIAIPIREYYSVNFEIPKQHLSGTHDVYFPVAGRSVTFNIRKTSIKVAPEGAIVLFSMRRNPKYKEIIENGNGMVIDPGRRSTDIGIFKRFEIEGKSVRSFPHGGISMEAALSAELDNMNIPVVGDDLLRVFEEGVSGGKPVGALVHKAKEIFGGMLRQDIVSVLAHSEMSLKNIDYIVPIGRPFLEQPSSEVEKDTYTGSLIKEVKKGMREDVVVIDCGNLETANVTALYSMLG